MTTLPDVEILVSGETVTLPLAVASPVTLGSVDACLARTASGDPAHGSVARQLVTRDGRVPALTLYARDLLAQWPRGGRCYLVVRYAGTVIASGAVRLVVA